MLRRPPPLRFQLPPPSSPSRVLPSLPCGIDHFSLHLLRACVYLASRESFPLLVWCRLFLDVDPSTPFFFRCCCLFSLKSGTEKSLSDWPSRRFHSSLASSFQDVLALARDCDSQRVERKRWNDTLGIETGCLHGSQRSAIAKSTPAAGRPRRIICTPPFLLLFFYYLLNPSAFTVRNCFYVRPGGFFFLFFFSPFFPLFCVCVLDLIAGGIKGQERLMDGILRWNLPPLWLTESYQGSSSSLRGKTQARNFCFSTIAFSSPMVMILYCPLFRTACVCFPFLLFVFFFYFFYATYAVDQ